MNWSRLGGSVSTLMLCASCTETNPRNAVETGETFADREDATNSNEDEQTHDDQ